MYRPNSRKQCCPHYTIRLDSHEFKPSRSQRQVINRFNRYVLGDEYTKEIARLHPLTREQARNRDTQFCFPERLHEAEYSKLKTPPEPAHKLVVTLEDNAFTEEKYAVWDNYQRVVHKEAPADRSRGSFKRFLCDSKLRKTSVLQKNGTRKLLGSYHQCYRLDGKLVAVGVLDLLPQCVSSVYFLYDESIMAYAPGKLSALNEIGLALEGGYRWWYPGYYIHSCPKMRYKMDFRPQYILDPETHNWDALDDQVMDLLDKSRYVSISRERMLVDSSNADDDAANKNKNSDDLERSLFQSQMPGIPTLDEMAKMNLGEVHLAFEDGDTSSTVSDTTNWYSGDIKDLGSLKHGVAELVAALGPDTTPLICLDYRPGHN